MPDPNLDGGGAVMTSDIIQELHDEAAETGGTEDEHPLLDAFLRVPGGLVVVGALVLARSWAQT